MEKRYIQTFETGESLQEALNIKKLEKPYVAYVEDEQSIDWNTKEIDYAGTYLTIEALEDGVLYVRIAVCQYSINGGEWVSASNPVISVLNGDIIRFKGNADSANIMFQDNTLAFNVYGNIMSLKYGDNFKGQTNVFSVQSFFQNSTGLTSAEHLVLPATTLANGCYQQMFYGCTSLASAPELPATTLTESCYSTMFYGCTSLTTAPALPAETLANFCYTSMFDGCTSLTNAPVLPATKLAGSCYCFMFEGCTSLTTAPELPATTLANSCYEYMFHNCTGLTAAPSLPATTLAENCYSNMFWDCSSLTTAPELPATTLVKDCYYRMFHKCNKLNYIKCLALVDEDYWQKTREWVRNVSPTGTFVKHPNAEWETGDDGIPRNWTVIDANI